MRLKIFFLLLLTILLALFSISAVEDPDIWMHFTLGKYILIHHYIPKTDIFTYTCYGHPWLTHEWFVSVIFYSIFHLFGINGIIVFKFLILFFAFLFLYKLGMEMKIPLWLLSLIFILSFFTLGPGFAPRAQIFTFLFISMELYYTYLFRNNKIKKRKFVIVILSIFLFWANMHIGVLFGLGILFLFLIFEKPLTIKFSILLFFASLFVALINPNTYQIFIYPLKTIFTKNQEIKKFIIEYLPLFSKENFGLTILTYFKIFFIISVVSWIINIKNKEFFLPAISIIFSILAFSAYRFLPLFVIASLPSVFYTLNNLKIEGKQAVYNVLTIIILIFIIFHISLFGINRGKGIRSYVATGVQSRVFPKSALNFIQQNRINGRIYNSYDFGEYLIWKGFPVFIDGRSDVCGMDIMEKAFKIESGEGKDLITKYHIAAFLLNYSPMTKYDNYSIHKYLWKNPDWKLVYWDDAALLYVKDIPEYRNIIQQYSCKYLNPKLRSWSSAPFDSIIKEAKEKITEDNQCLTAFYLLGNAYIKKGEYNTAIEKFKHIIHIAPDDPITRSSLMRIGDAYMLLNDRESALYYYRWAYKFNKNLKDIKKKINTAKRFLIKK